MTNTKKQCGSIITENRCGTVLGAGIKKAAVTVEKDGKQCNSDFPASKLLSCLKKSKTSFCMLLFFIKNKVFDKESWNKKRKRVA
jgi:hypothetical protein